MDKLGALEFIVSRWGFYPAWIRVLAVVTGVLIIFTIIVLLGWSQSAARKQEAAAKDIRIEFEPNSPCFNLNPAGVDDTGNPRQVYLLSFRIHNNSPAFTARNTRVMLMELLHERDGQYIPEARFQPLPLGWDWASPRDIKPKAKAYAPFGTVGNPAWQAANAANLSGGISVPHFRFTPPLWPARMTSHVDPGKHRFTVGVLFDGEPPRTQQFELEWTGRWADDEDSMLKEIMVKKID